MKLRGLERKKEAAMKECGFAEMSFSQILKTLEREDQKVYLPIFEKLCQEVQLFSEIHIDAGTMLEVKLRHLSQLNSNQINQKA